MYFMKNFFFILFLIASSAKAQRNVIVIIADDLGSDYCGFYENHVDTAKMPNVRKLLSRGVKLNEAWSNPLCSPTRAGILTGRYSFRTGVGDVIAGAGSKELDTSELTIPRLLKSLSSNKIKTANIGKWHVSTPKPSQLKYPNIMGYDHYAGNFSGTLNSYTNWSKITNGATSTCTNYATTEQTNDAIDWLKSNQNSQTFLWLAFNAPHTPYHLPPSSLHTDASLTGTPADISARPKSYFKAMVEAMDTEIGRLLDSLKVLNLYDNTDIIFIGDNGDDPLVNQGTNSSKGSLYQDGVHVPFIVSGPSVASQNRSSDALVNTVDIFATVLELFGYSNWQNNVPANKPVDSKSVLPILKNEISTVRDWAFTEIFKVSAASGDGKTMRNKTHKLIDFDNGTQKFYNLQKDPQEKSDLIPNKLSEEDGANYAYLCQEMTKLVGVSRFCDDNVGTQQLSLQNEIYPNPFTDFLHVPNVFCNQKFMFTNALGQFVFEGQNLADANLTSLPSGIYHLVFAEIPKINLVFCKK